MTEQQGRFLLYNSGNEWVKAQVMLEWDTVWMSQKSMAELFDTSKQNISQHLNNIFDDWELLEESVVKEFLTTASDEKNYKTQFYNLDAIISVGYRVSSKRATQFRIWATSVLKEYLIKWFVLDDERLSQGKELFGKDYFKELLGRVRSIRSFKKNKKIKPFKLERLYFFMQNYSSS